MRSLFLTLLVLSLGLPAGLALATTVGGDLTYGGLPVSDTFNNMQSGVMQVRSIDQGTTVNHVFPVGDSYEVPADLAPGTYRLWFLLTPRPEETGTTHWSGDLHRAVGLVDVPDQPGFELDVDLQLAVHVTEPLDSLTTWPGATCRVCPKGAPQPSTFTFGWAEVPRAVDYELQIYRRDCSGGLTPEIVPVAGTSAEIEQGLVPGEEYLEIEVLAYDDQERLLSVSPYILYSDGCGPYRFTFQPEQEGRPIHGTGQHVAQIASVGGVGSSFWSSALILTNPTAEDITTAVYYTPRDAEGLIAYQEASVTVPAGSCRVVADALGTLFETTGAGAIEITSPDLVVASRTSTPAAAGGAYGQGLMPITGRQVLSSFGSAAVAGGVVKEGGARTNLVLNEVWGESATARVSLMDRNGALLGARDYPLAAYSNHQINDLVRELSERSELSEGQIEVSLESDSGRVAATLSIVDASDDPITVPVLVVP